MELKVTARAVALFEKETGVLLQDVINTLHSEKKFPSVDVIAKMIKASSNLSIDESYAYIDENEGAIVKVINAYGDWALKAWTVAESGNLEASATAQG